MTEEGLKIISDVMDEIVINYEFMEWSSEPVDLYFTGEYQEREPGSEDGEQESEFILTGFARGEGAGLALENAKKTIKKAFPQSGGKTVTAEDGTVVAIFYTNSFPIRTGDAELKKIQINLLVKEWSVN